MFIFAERKKHTTAYILKLKMNRLIELTTKIITIGNQRLTWGC